LKKIKVAIADDHKALRLGLIYAFSEYKDIKIAFEAVDGEELLIKLKSTPVDVILLDINMPKMDGLEALKIIRATNKTVKIIVYTMYALESKVLDCMDAIANSYLVKNSEPEEVYRAIKECMEHGYYFNDFVKNSLANRVVHKNKLDPNESKPLVEFDEREMQILKMIYEQKTTLQIAGLLTLGDRLVESIRSTLLKKTNSKNVVGLINYCNRNKIFDEE
jgi:DNA-binding NarL/FixJ family response regulator